MQFSKNRKTFCQCFSQYLESVSNFQHFEKVDDFDSLCIAKIRDCERHGQTNV